MANQLCLSRDEIRELCRSPRRATQVRFLQQNGIRHYIDAYGWPVVLRSAVGEPVQKQEPATLTWVSNKMKEL